MVKRLKYIRLSLFIINVAFGLLLILSISAVYISPLTFWLPAIAGIAFLEILTANMVFFVLWLFVKRKYTIFSLIFIIFGLIELPNHIQFNQAATSNNKTIDVLTLNVRNFDLYNWTSNKKTRNNILSVIKSRDAEIICLQEFFNTTNPKHDFKTLDTILEFENQYKSHVEYTSTVKNTEHWGIATFTTFPIIAKGFIPFEDSSNNACIYTDISIGKKMFRIYNVHLASVRFKKEDYDYLKDMADNNMEPKIKESKSLLMKLKNAFERRTSQVKLIAEHMQNSPYPIILCGDFNDTPTSYAYYNLSRGLNDTFKEKGSGLGSTYNGNLPFLRIDYIFTDPSIEVLQHDVIHSDISDHFPVAVTLEIKN